MKKVLLLSTCTENALPGLWCLREAHYTSIVVGNISENLDLKHSPLCKKFYEIPESFTFENKSDQINAIIRNIVNIENIDIIVPSGFESIKFLCEHKNVLSDLAKVMTLPSFDLIETMGNKYSFSLFCTKNNIPHPKTFFLQSKDEASRAIMDIGLPLIVKPLDLAGSEGIYKFNTKDDLFCYLSGENGDKRVEYPLLLQEFLPGHDVDFFAFATNGKINAWSITRRVEISRKNMPPLKWSQFYWDKSVFEISTKIIKECNYSGPLNIDFYVDSRDGSINTLEVNTRFWATTLYSQCDGINFYDVAIQSTYDKNFSKSPKCSNRVWGSPHRLPSLVLNNRGLYHYIKKHTWFQVKYLLLTKIFALVTLFKKMCQRGCHKGHFHNMTAVEIPAKLLKRKEEQLIENTTKKEGINNA